MGYKELKSMEITVDNFGRILIPLALRKHIGLKAGTILEVEESASKIILKPKEEKNLLRVKEDIVVYSGDIENSGDFIREEREKRTKKLSGI